MFIGKKFPDITVKAVDKSGNIYDFNILEYSKKNKKKVVLFWYPKDFTFVCPTELFAFESKKSEFEKRNCTLIGASCDTAEVHLAWMDREKNNGGIKGISYILLSDCNRNLSSILGILDGIKYENSSKEDMVLFKGDNVSYRATYLIDEHGFIFHITINHMPIGRNINEYLRLIDAYSHVQKYGEVCPANWQVGKEAMTPTQKGVSDYLSKIDI